MSTSKFILDFIKLFFEKTWELLSIPWPGFSFSIAEAFIGILISCVALSALLRMVGVGLPKSDDILGPVSRRNQKDKERSEKK